MSDKKKTCIIYDSWNEVIQNLPDEMAGQLIKGVLGYAFDEEELKTDNPAINAILQMMKSKIDENSAKYQEKVERMDSARKQLKQKTDRNQSEISQKSDNNQDDIKSVSVSESVSDSVNESDNGYPSDTKKRGGNSARFTPPTVAEVRDYCLERNNGIDAEQFVDFYASKGWMVGKNKMKDWRSCVRTWERRDRASPKKDFDSNEYLLGIINGGDIYDGTRSG